MTHPMILLRPLGEVLPEMPARFPDAPPETWARLVETPAPLLSVYVLGAVIETYDPEALVVATDRVICSATSNPRILTMPRGWTADRRVRTQLLRLDRRRYRRERRGNA